MASFNLCRIAPSSFHIFNCYQEVIDAIAWGLYSLGHQVTCSVNYIDPTATNIVFCAQVANRSIIDEMPDDTIIYNLEQMEAMLGERDVLDEWKALAERFTVWDYSAVNIEWWPKFTNPKCIKHVPIGFAPNLCRISKADEQDIDVLFYGGPNVNRLKVLQDLCDHGLKVMYFFGMYGKPRDDLIARAKVVLNISYYNHIFEIVRVSYLLANKKAVVSIGGDGLVVENDIIDGIRFVHADKVAAACYDLISDDQDRVALEEKGFSCFSARNISVILSAALS